MVSVKRELIRRYLGYSLAHVRRQVRASAPRSFAKVYIVAELSRNTGISQGARLQHAFFRSRGVNAELIDATNAARNPLYRVEHEKGTAYIFHSGGPQIATMLRSVLPHAANAYRIAYWAWEIPAAPRGWPPAGELVSEIWSCSAYSSSHLRTGYNLPVVTVPHAIVGSDDFTPKQPHETFEVLSFADTRSSLVRKNPEAAIAAFRLAFGNDERARLTLKLSGRPGDLAPLTKQAQGSNIRVLTDFLTEEKLRDLYRSSDVLISLHRAEGFGLPMLEAMSHGLPVVATNWSGNLEYMNPENSMLVPHSMVRIGDDSVYRNYSEISWADPDVNAAADCLKILASNPSTYRRISGNARRTVFTLADKQQLPFDLGQPEIALALPPT